MPLFGRSSAPEGWLMLPPLLYLVHFYYVISNSQRPVGINEKDEPGAHLPHTAQSYVDVIITAGASVLIYGVSPWQSRTGNRSTLGERELAERGQQVFGNSIEWVSCSERAQRFVNSRT